MKDALSVVSEWRDRIAEIVSKFKGEPNVVFADLRFQAFDGQGVSVENGEPKYSGRNEEFVLGTRVLAGLAGLVSPGYYGISFGRNDIDNIHHIVEKALNRAYRRALANAENKSLFKHQYAGVLTETLQETILASAPIVYDTVPATYKIWPIDVGLKDIIDYGVDVSTQVKSLDNIMFNEVAIHTLIWRELLVNTEGTNIEQTFAQTQGIAAVLAAKDGYTPFSIWDVSGHQRGWEQITDGSEDEFIPFPPFNEFALGVARDAQELVVAPRLSSSDKEVVVITDPHYNTLLVHEIVGHPSEADRALKMETAYAGRSWLLQDLGENQIGKQVASSLLSAYSDPRLPGYGHYKYDHEGVLGKKVTHIKEGVFNGFMNSRQTAALLGAEPNGSWKATTVNLVPLIRMSNTVFANGTRNPQKIIGEVEHGYYFVGHNIPSISESRENFRISSQKVYEIRNGKLGQLFRDGSIMADSKTFFMNIDAVGNDFRLYPVPHCGKGQPMQTKKLGNGGPTLRSRAKVVGTERGKK